MDKTLEILQHKFNIDEYKKFCMQFLNLTKDQLVLLKEQKIGYPVYRDYVYSYFKIADYTDNDGKTMMVLAIKLINTKAAERARSMQRNLVARLLEDFSIEAALVAFYSDEDTSWRLSYVNLDYEFTAEGLKKKLTPAKRYSYLVGQNEPNHTAKEQLKNIYLDDKNNPSIKEIEEAFKIEKVTKRFFDEYRDKYLELKEFLEDNDEFVKESDRLGFTSEEFSKKLMGQLAFLYFLQKKGWLGVKAVPHEIQYSDYVKIYDRQNELVRNILSKVFKRSNANMELSYTDIKGLSDLEGDYLSGAFANYIEKNEPEWGQWGSGNKKFIRELFNICAKENEKARKNNSNLKVDRKNFFNDYLEPLFYSALNTKRGANEYFKLFNCKIPFLNGGLFEPIYDYDWKNIHIKIPNKMFSNISENDEFGTGILDMFDTYNFTMNEDEPLEKEVAIDPEMLGKIFENLLDVKDRKSKGAFYTPREIVHYMCQESLINYLHNETGVDREDIDNFIKLGDFIVDEDSRTMIGSKDKSEYLIPTSIYDNKEKFDEVLKNVKIADPAVGSGAFPLGMLNEIVRIRSYLTIYITQGLNKYDRWEVERNRSNYKLKEEVMKYVIHAVDIERSAVDITKLRLWLSLIVDADIHTVNALPNLDSNIKCGNSLIDEFEGIKLFDESMFCADNNNSTVIQMKFSEGKEKQLLDKLEKLQKELFDAKEPNKKKEIKKFIENTEWELIEYKLKKDGNEDKIEKFEFLKKEQRKPYFIWKMEFSDVFREKGGFDIVIGNPPYVKVQNIDNNISRILKNNYKSATGKYDLYVLFVENGFDIINEKGIVSFIHPHRFLKVEYGKGLRNYLKECKGLNKFIHFGVNQIFDTATTYTGIFFYSKNNSNIKFFELNSKELKNIKFNTYKYEKLKERWEFSNNEESTVLEKIESQEFKVKDVFKGVYQGVITVGDDIFILNGNIKNELFYGYSKALERDVCIEKEIMKPLLKGENIRRYLDSKSDIYIFYPHYINEKNKTKPIEEDVLAEKYPLAYSYINNFKDYLTDKKIKYKTNPKYWYSLHRARDMNIFQQFKIITPQLQNYPHFTIDNNNFYPDAGGYSLILSDSSEFEYKFYLALLNSKLMWYFIQNTSTPFNNGYYYFKTKYLEPFGLPKITNPKLKEDIVKQVEQIYELKKRLNYCQNVKLENEIEMVEKKIDYLVYDTGQTHE